ncbi:MAG: dihydrolipoamide acetyltransferase, partial [Myxococcales bacterium]|nr:dihydrolipoamide acetyltransferase [Myxococcales bacterium]
MPHQVEVRVPDVGEAEQVEVIEVLVAAGDRVAVDDVIVTLESDKATLELPSPRAGVVQSVGVAVGDEVVEGTLLLVLEVEPDEATADAAAAATTE